MFLESADCHKQVLQVQIVICVHLFTCPCTVVCTYRPHDHTPALMHPGAPFRLTEDENNWVSHCPSHLSHPTMTSLVSNVIKVFNSLNWPEWITVVYGQLAETVTRNAYTGKNPNPKAIFHEFGSDTSRQWSNAQQSPIFSNALRTLHGQGPRWKPV